MTKLGPIELEVVFLGIKKNGVFNEKDLESSELKKLGVGKILDVLGELRERELISIGREGFTVTEKSKEYLWGKTIPMSIKLLRVLRIKPYNLDEISKYLLINADEIDLELEKLRKRGFVLMSPVWKDTLLEKTFEILQEGLEYLDAVESGKSQDIPLDSKTAHASEILSEIRLDIESLQEINSEKKRDILEKLQKLKNTLD